MVEHLHHGRHMIRSNYNPFHECLQGVKRRQNVRQRGRGRDPLGSREAESVQPLPRQSRLFVRRDIVSESNVSSLSFTNPPSILIHRC